SVMSLFIELRSKGERMGTGTGFVALAPNGRPVLLTNWHNVTGRHPETWKLRDPEGRMPDALHIMHFSKEVKESNQSSLHWIARVEPLYDGPGKPRWIEHPTHKEKVDAVALPLTQLSEVTLLPYRVDQSTARASGMIRCGPADVVSVVGFPFGETGGGALAVWATGFVATEPVMNWRDLPCFLVDCRARPGQSGSAVIAFRGGGAVTLEDGSTALMAGPTWRLLGIYSGRINEQSDLGIVWKTSALQEILAAVPAPAQAGAGVA
ncbi:MAG: trypsin-like peptidase domain-containing protein, partial [Planctomycetota bacterium]|nr:trypsin-like peptidase domain-containing protein [Planctomycetota bacterium]